MNWLSATRLARPWRRRDLAAAAARLRSDRKYAGSWAAGLLGQACCVAGPCKEKPIDQARPASAAGPLHARDGPSIAAACGKHELRFQLSTESAHDAEAAQYS